MSAKSVTVRYFAVLRDRRGLGEETLSTECDTIGDFIRELVVRYRLDLAPALIRAAQDGSFVDDSTPLRDGAQIVLVPPVAGG